VDTHRWRAAGAGTARDRLLDVGQSVLAVGLADDFGGEFVQGHDRLALEHVFRGPLDGGRERYGLDGVR